MTERNGELARRGFEAAREGEGRRLTVEGHHRHHEGAEAVVLAQGDEPDPERIGDQHLPATRDQLEGLGWAEELGTGPQRRQGFYLSIIISSA